MISLLPLTVKIAIAVMAVAANATHSTHLTMPPLSSHHL